jgi:hypothetical protein
LKKKIKNGPIGVAGQLQLKFSTANPVQFWSNKLIPVLLQLRERSCMQP